LATELFIERMMRELEGVQFVNKKAQEIAGREVWLEGGDVIQGDAVVVAAGYWARKLGIPVAPFKGYGFRTNANAEKMFIEMSKGVAVVPLS
jgi:D-proline dehydrogenase